MEKGRRCRTVDWVIQIKSSPHWFVLAYCCNTLEFRCFFFVFFFNSAPHHPPLAYQTRSQVCIFMILHDNSLLFHVKTYVNSEICTLKPTSNSQPQILSSPGDSKKKKNVVQLTKKKKKRKKKSLPCCLLMHLISWQRFCNSSPCFDWTYGCHFEGSLRLQLR